MLVIDKDVFLQKERDIVANATCQKSQISHIYTHVDALMRTYTHRDMHLRTYISFFKVELYVPKAIKVKEYWV